MICEEIFILSASFFMFVFGMTRGLCLLRILGLDFEVIKVDWFFIRRWLKIWVIRLWAKLSAVALILAVQVQTPSLVFLAKKTFGQSYQKVF